LELFKDKKSKNLLEAIEKSKKQPLSRLIYGLGIRHVGEKAAYVLAQKFRTLDNLMKAKQEDFDAIYEVGGVLAGSIVKFFQQESTQRLVKKLKDTGLNLQEKVIVLKKSPLAGKTVVFTGELKSFTRSHAEDLVRQFGGNASSNVNKNTDWLVAGENPGSKYDKAKKLGIEIIGEEAFSRLIGSK
jgi:DNA ligase (NAD+)